MQGNSSSNTGEYGMDDMKEVKKHVEQHGVSGIENFFKDRLDEWKDVEVNIGITGDSGVGKSSFINAIRGVKDDDEFAAATGITETTRKAAKYPHPTNPKITFWDLPGIGTPNYPNLRTYCRKVKLEKLDTFLILTAKRFTENDRLLAEKVKSLKKSYFFIRTQIDIDYENEWRKRGFNEEAMLNNIREYCLRYLKANDEVFLISNRYPAKWEFARLTQAILDVFPLRQRECLTLSLDLLTSFSKDILRRKIKFLRDRIYKVAVASCVGALIPIPGLSIAVDIVLLREEVKFYKSQFGLPEENSAEFKRMTRESQEIMRKSCLSASIQILNRLAVNVASNTAEEFIRYIPVVGGVMAGGLSYATTSRFLHQYLEEMEGVAFALLDEMNIRSREDSDINLLNDILKRKIKQIRDRIWMVAAASSVGALFSVCVGALFLLCVGALFPVSVGAPFLVFALSIVIDTALLTKEVKSYYSQVCLPEESSYEFETLTQTTQDKVRKFRFVTPARIGYLFPACAVSFGVEECVRYIPLVGSVAAGGISFLSTYSFLHEYLKIMEETAFECLERTRSTTRAVDSKNSDSLTYK